MSNNPYYPLGQEDIDDIEEEEHEDCEEIEFCE